MSAYHTSDLVEWVDGKGRPCIRACIAFPPGSHGFPYVPKGMTVVIEIYTATVSVATTNSTRARGV